MLDGLESGEDDGTLAALGHGPHDAFVEGACLAGGADEDVRPEGPHDLLEGRLFRVLERQAHASHDVLAQGQVPLELVDVRAAGMHQAAGIGEGDVGADLRPVEASLEQGGAQQPRDADAGRARAGQQEAHLGNAPAQRPGRRVQAGQHDGGRALHVVVEAGHLISEEVQDAQGIGPLEVLPLDDAAGPHLLDTLHERPYQLLVGRSPEAARPVAEVEGVGEELPVVGAHVERDGQGQRGMHAAGGRVEGQLADGDAHAARTLVAQAEDALVVSDDDEPHVRVG